MKISTFNVNGVNGRLARLLAWLSETAPDVVCLQEIKTGDATFPVQAIEAVGYGAVWYGQRTHHGVAILARGHAPREVPHRLVLARTRLARAASAQNGRRGRRNSCPADIP